MHETNNDGYEIATEDGRMFCKCNMNEGTPVFTTKEGSLPLTLLLEQAYDPKVAQKLRQRGRKKKEPVLSTMKT